jgi:hypothetical protein
MKIILKGDHKDTSIKGRNVPCATILKQRLNNYGSGLMIIVIFMVSFDIFKLKYWKRKK